MKLKKAVVCALSAIMVVMTLSACGGSVGNVKESESHKELFPDNDYSGNYKASNLGYNFTLGENYGEMMVYVDTSEGHKFEVRNEPTGFAIMDEAGNDVIQAVCIDKEPYAEYSAYCSEVKTINGRDFLYRENLDGSKECYSYMADCGLDCGLAMVSLDGKMDDFRLVAFRGDALDGASSDVYFYQGTLSYDEPIAEEDIDDISDEPEEDVISDEAISEDDNSEATNSDTQSLTTSTLTDEVESTLRALQNDYGKVLWGVEYSPFADFPGIVVSITPCPLYGDDNGLIVAITNLYSEPFAISGSAQALDASGNVIGDTFLYYPCIGSGCTNVEIIDCGSDVPDGRIHWEELSTDEPFGKYIPWEADWAGHGDGTDGTLSLDYSIYASNGETCSVDRITVLFLDSQGFVRGVATDYGSELEANGKCEGTVTVNGTPEQLTTVESIAMFVSTVSID